MSRSHRFPTPAIVVFTNDRFAVTCTAGRPVVGVPAEFTRLVACSLIGEWVAGRLRRGSGRWCGGNGRW